MGKHDEKKDKRRKKDLEREESNHRTTASNSTNVDGHALDEICRGLTIPRGALSE